MNKWNLDDLTIPPQEKAELDFNDKPWSPMQMDIFKAIVAYNGNDTYWPDSWLSEPDGAAKLDSYISKNIIVRAGAGSGKTTTIVKGASLVPEHEDCIFLAFNKSIAETLAKKLPPHVPAKTFHALGFSVLRATGVNYKVDGGKVRKIAKSFLHDTVYEEIGNSITRFVGEAKSSMLDPTQDDVISDITTMIFESEVDTGHYSEHQVARYVLRALELSNRQVVDDHVIDFDDMLYLPLYMDLTFPRYDRVFVDEAQDLNYIQHLLVETILDGQLIAVGDPNQAIYAFRGADSNSFNTMKQKFNCLELPLSVTYRCGTSIVRDANAIVPDLLTPEGAHEGEVLHLPAAPPVDVYQPGDLVLCRNNAPLFRLGLEFIKARKPFTIRTNLEASIRRYIKQTADKAKDASIESFKEALSSAYEKEYKLAEEKNRTSRMAYLTDLYNAGLALCEEAAFISDLYYTLDQLFIQGHGPVLSTIHKAKGEEADRVFIHQPELIPSRFATSNSARQQEFNLLYVAITRAKERLTYSHNEEL